MTDMRELQTAELADEVAGGKTTESARASGAHAQHSARIVLARPRSLELRERLGNLTFVITSLVMRDFRIRYRNMSLGVLWSLANPLIMMLVLTFVFVRVFPNSTIKSFPIFFLTGLIPFNFFTLAWSAGTVSLYGNASLVKRVRVQKELIPISAVLAQSLHFLIQMALLLIFVLAVGLPVTMLWLWIAPIMLVELISVSGMALLCSAFDVYLRDTRYVVDSTVTVLFWLSPIFYPFALIPPRYRLLYELNPVASAVICLRNVLLDVTPPTAFGVSLTVALVILGIGIGVFTSLKSQFGDHL
jgi:ABC-type polysaccharide/polyol phosphate export permease